MSTLANTDIRTWRSAAEVNSAMAGVYKNMGLATVISMIVSWFVGSTPELFQFFFTGWMKWVTVFSPLVAIFAVSYAMDKVTKSTAYLLLIGFSALMGLSFASIFAIYKLGSIFNAFLSAAVLFSTLSIWGYFTKKDLSGWGNFLIVGVIALILSSIINIFIGSSALQMTISAIAVIIFLGLTAYDTQRIREMVMYQDPNGKAEVVGALTLYLDFINIFLSLLQLFGDKKE